MRKLYILIAGSRNFSDYELLKDVLKEEIYFYIADRPYFEIIEISGTAKGADQLGAQWAKDNKYQVIEFPADWDKYGRSAGHIRNAEMVNFIKNKEDKLAIFFWDGESRGTEGCISLCIKNNVNPIVIKYK